MLYRAFRSFAAVSLLLFLATVVFWVRSYWVWDSYEKYHNNNKSHWNVDSVFGYVYFGNNDTK